MVIKTVSRAVEHIPQMLEKSLPYILCEELFRVGAQGRIEEIRIRRDRRASVVLSGRNVMLDYKAQQGEISEILTRMCKGSLYAYSDTINQGYISLPDGIRVGVGGRATCEGERIIGGCGIIANDFHKRPDLTPNLCALYVEEDCRGLGIAGRLLNNACADMAARGVDTLYLCTDHESFYERYGWEFYCMVEEDGGGECRMYRKVQSSKFRVQS